MGWMGIGWILGLALLAVLVWALASAFRPRGGADESPEAILKRRYARGEIDREAYQRMLADLERRG